MAWFFPYTFVLLTPLLLLILQTHIRLCLILYSQDIIYLISLHVYTMKCKIPLGEDLCRVGIYQKINAQTMKSCRIRFHLIAKVDYSFIHFLYIFNDLIWFDLQLFCANIMIIIIIIFTLIKFILILFALEKICVQEVVLHNFLIIDKIMINCLLLLLFLVFNYCGLLLVNFMLYKLLSLKA